METAQGLTSVIEEEVREIANLLSKTAKNYQMYLSNNRMFISSLDSLKTTLDAFLEENDVLTFVVKEFELAHHDAIVYSNTDKYQSIAFRMYRDGIRLISFHHGITNDELLAFFEVLTRCLEADKLEEDFVTLLWEKDLQAITYYEVNDFEDNYDLKKGDGKRGQLRPDLLGQEFSPSQWNQVSHEVEKLKPTLSLTAEDLQEVRDLAFTVGDDLFLRRVWQVLSLAFEADESKEAYIDLENALKGFLDTCLTARQLGLAGDALARIRSVYGEFNDEEVAQAISRIVASRHSDKNMAAIENALAGGREVEHVQCLAYLSRLSEEAIPSIFRLLDACGQQSARQTVISSLASLAENHPRSIVACIDETSPDDVESAMDILETIGTDDALSTALRFDKHTSARVRGKLVSMIGTLRTDAASETARRLLNDPDASVRRRAVVSLVKICGAQATDALIGLFTTKEFNAQSHDYKLSILLAIRSLSPQPQRDVLGAIFKMRSFLRRRPIEDPKIALIEIMHLMDHDVALQTLDYLVNSSSGKTGKAAKNALKKVRDENRVD
jgi:HEAT repeat protein